jgi:hypothetical protein
MYVTRYITGTEWDGYSNSAVQAQQVGQQVEPSLCQRIRPGLMRILHIIATDLLRNLPFYTGHISKGVQAVVSSPDAST